MPKVSVIVPVYNVAPYIERCARSLFGQTLEDMEFIFVDDCSPDESMAVLRRVMQDYPERVNQVKIRSHKTNRGSSYARNTGLEIAEGDFVAYCDSDDWVSRDMYERLYNEAKRTGADVCYCDFYKATAEETVLTESVALNGDKETFLCNYISSGLTVVWNMLVSRSLYVGRNLKFPESFVYCEDFWLSVRIFYFARKISKVNVPLYFYNQMNVSSLLHTRNERIMRDELLCYEGTIDFFRNEGVLDLYHKVLCWRILKCKQDLALDSKTYKQFLQIYPQSHKYIWSCPETFCNIKVKFMMWLLVHKASLLVSIINRLRGILK